MISQNYVRYMINSFVRNINPSYIYISNFHDNLNYGTHHKIRAMNNTWGLDQYYDMSSGTYTITIVKQYDLYRHRIFCTSGHLLARSLWRLATAASFRRVFIKLPRRLNKLSSKKAVALCFSKLPSPSSPSCHEKAVALCFSKLPKPSSTSCHKKAAEPFFNKLSSKKLWPCVFQASCPI